MGERRTIAGIGYNHLGTENRLFVTTNTLCPKKRGQHWDNGKVESVSIDGRGCHNLGIAIITGLPV